MAAVNKIAGASASTRSTLRLVRADADRETCFAPQHEDLQLTLYENGSTGYAWEASLSQDAQNAEPALEIKASSRFEMDPDCAEGKKVGCGGYRTWDIVPTRTLRSGEKFTLILLNRRPWVPRSSEDVPLRFRLVVA